MALFHYLWSRTAASNATADTNINWAEGQSPSSVNDSARAMMASAAGFRDDISGAIVTTGTSTAYAVTSYQVFDTLAHMNGQMIAFTPHATNGANVTLNVDGLGAKPLRGAPSVELPSGSLILGTPYIAVYNNSDAVWYLHGGMSNPYNTPLGGGMIYTGPSAPNSAFVFPFGQAISRTTYASYFSLVGTTFGVGDNSTTFNVLDLRGTVPAGVDNMGGVSGGRFPGLNLGTFQGAVTQTLGTANLPAYTPSGSVPIVDPGHVHGTRTVAITIGGAGPVHITGGGGTPTAVESATTGITASFTGTAQGGTSTAFSIVQPTIGCNYILRII